MGVYSLCIIFQITRTGHYSGARSTSVWWETQIDPTLVFGIPMIVNIGVKEKRHLENFQLEPDIRASLPYDALINGKGYTDRSSGEGDVEGDCVRGISKRSSAHRLQSFTCGDREIRCVRRSGKYNLRGRK